jgi:outer membrane protein assembly factor BamA
MLARRCALIALLAAASLGAQRPRGLEVSGLPALNFDADEGLGYGAILALYDYGASGVPYRYTLQPTLFLTTQGRRDFTVFADAPAVLPRGWRVTAFAGREQQLATPYYGVGNQTTYDPALEQGSTRYFYRYGHDRLRASADFQHTLGASPARILLGAGASRDIIDLSPFDSGRTLIEAEMGGRTPPAAHTSYVRVGLIWDTRDREIGTHRGVWATGIAQHVGASLSSGGYTRWTATLRSYHPIGDRITVALRELVQQTSGDVPFYELATIQTELKPQDGLGGSSSIRGIPKDRYVGKALALSNSEVRWRAADFALHGRASSLILSGFVDAGRVFTDSFDPSLLVTNIHAGYGGGARLSFGQSFVIATDVGHSSQSTAPIYIGLGYLF